MRAARAHALAALTRTDEAVAELRSLAADTRVDIPILERIARHRGPASSLAERLLAEAGTPHR